MFFAFIVLAIFINKGVFYLADPSTDITWDLKLITIGALNIGMLIALLINYEKTKRYIPYVLAIYISQTGFSYEIEPGYQTSANEALTFAILLVWAVRRAISQGSPTKRHYFSKNVFIFLLISLMGIITAYWIFQVRPLNIFIVSKSYMLYLFYLYLVPDCVRSEKEFFSILVFIMILSLFPMYYAVTGGMAIQNIEYTRLSVGEWGALNIFVGYIMPIYFISLGFLLFEKKVLIKLIIFIYMCGIIYVLILAQTRTAWVGVIAGTGLFIFMIRRKLIPVVASILLVTGLMLSPYGEHLEQTITKRIVEQTLNPDHSLRERYSRWDAAWATVTTYPFTGSGWGGLLPVAWDGSVGDTSTTLLPLWHNAYLELLSQLGFPGLLVFFLLWLKIVRVEGMRLLRSKQSRQSVLTLGIFVGVITCLIYALAEQQFYRIETASHTYFLTGLLLAGSNILNAKKTEDALKQHDYIREGEKSLVKG
jgi:O-antigen ligase